MRGTRNDGWNKNFWPISVREVSDDLHTDERGKNMTRITDDNRAIRLGYGQVNQKIKNLRQNYRRAVTEEERSGSGHLMTQNWTLL